jgi:hypothetical protein
MSDFDSNGDWNAMAHVRFLRAQGGACSGFTADLIEKLYLALVRSETNIRHWRDECGKLHAQIAGLKWKAELKNDQVTVSLDHYNGLISDHQKLAESDHVNDKLRQRLGLGEAENKRLERVIKKLQADLLSWEITAKRIKREEATRTCNHHWQIWPETDGQEQRCMKCGQYRKTQLPIEECGNHSAGSPP